MTTTRRPLATHELHYISSVRQALAGVTRTTRRELITTLTENLLDRPPTADRETLETALGTPVEYADRLLEEAEEAEPGSITRSRRRHRLNLTAITAAVIVAVTAATLTYRWWDNWQVGVIQYMQGVCAGEVVNQQTCDGSMFTTTGGPLMTITSADCVKDARFILQLEFGTSRPVSVTAVDFPGAHFAGGEKIRLDAVTVHPRKTIGDVSAQTVPFPVAIGPDSAVGYEFQLHFTMVCSTEHWAPGETIAYTTFRVSYRALGRDRVQDVPLMVPLQFTMPSH